MSTSKSERTVECNNESFMTVDLFEGKNLGQVLTDFTRLMI